MLHKQKDLTEILNEQGKSKRPNKIFILNFIMGITLFYIAKQTEGESNKVLYYAIAGTACVNFIYGGMGLRQYVQYLCNIFRHTKS